MPKFQSDFLNKVLNPEDTTQATQQNNTQPEPLNQINGDGNNHVRYDQLDGTKNPFLDAEHERAFNIELMGVLQQIESIHSEFILDLEPSLNYLLEQDLSEEFLLQNDRWYANIICAKEWLDKITECLDKRIIPPLEEGMLEHCTSSRQSSVATASTDMTQEHIDQADIIETAATSPDSDGEPLVIREPCHHCATANTPEWRRGPDGESTLCNACGLFFSKLFRGYNHDIATFLMNSRKRDGLSNDRRVPPTYEFNGVVYMKRKNGRLQA